MVQLHVKRFGFAYGIIAITKDPFIVFTSNIFAIMGMRSLYFAISGAADKFRYLKYGLSVNTDPDRYKNVLHEVLEIPTICPLLAAYYSFP